MAPTSISSALRLYMPHHHSSSTVTPQVTTTMSSSSDTTSTAEQSFTLPADSMPLPGPAHYEARRALWLTPASRPCEAYPPSPSTSRAKLEVLLSQEGKVDNDSVWNSGLRSVWKGLLGGGRLRRRLPLSVVIKILKAGWQHDGTWPPDSVTSPPSPALPPLPDLPDLPLPPPDDDPLRENDDL